MSDPAQARSHSRPSDYAALLRQAGASTLSDFTRSIPAHATVQHHRFVSLSVINLHGPAHLSDGTLNGVGGSHPGQPGHFLNGAEARVSNVAVIGCRPCAQHNRPLGGDETRRLSTGHLGSCRPLLGHGASGEAHRENGYEDRLQEGSPPLGSTPLQQARPASVPRAFLRDAVPSNNLLTPTDPASTLAIAACPESGIDAQERPQAFGQARYSFA